MCILWPFLTYRSYVRKKFIAPYENESTSNYPLMKAYVFVVVLQSESHQFETFSTKMLQIRRLWIWLLLCTILSPPNTKLYSNFAVNDFQFTEHSELQANKYTSVSGLQDKQALVLSASLGQVFIRNSNSWLFGCCTRLFTLQSQK